MNGLGITSDTQLRDLAKKLGFKLNYVGFAEQLPNKLPSGVNIINLGDQSIGGTHWTLLFVDDADHMAYYFDSYGAPPEDPIVNLINKSGYKLLCTKKQVQGYDEEYCGIWALMMANELYHRVHDRYKAVGDFLNRYKAV